MSSKADFKPEDVIVSAGSFVDGCMVEGRGDPITVLRPSDGEEIATFAGADNEIVERAVASGRAAAQRSGWAKAEPRKRGAVLRRWADLVLAHTDELARLESLSSSRVIAETRIRDVVITAELLYFYGECVDKMSGVVHETSPDVWSLETREPYGVVAAISPWNVPMVLATAKFAPALAAGNAVVLKPSELTPFSAIRLAQLGIEAGLPKGLFNVVVGYGHIAGSALVRHPNIGCVSFTGSTQTGAAIMSDAAQHGLKPVSLELGGKSPQIVFADAPDLDYVADVVANAATRNAGQLCYCGSRLVVDSKIADQLVEAVAARMSGAVPGPTWREDTTLAPIISHKQASRISDIVERGKAEGGEVVIGGETVEGGGNGAYYAPTMIEAGPANPVVHEEVFGPVLAVQRFNDIDEAMALASHPVYGLAGSIHTGSIDRALNTVRELEAGMIWVNWHGRTLDVALPFGGFKQSGFGKDFGAAAFEKYRRGKSVWIQTRPKG